MLKIKQSSKKILVLVALLILLGGLVLTWKVINKSESPNIDTVETINFDPPTQEEIQSIDENKERIVQEDKQHNSTTPSGTKNTVKPLITSAEQYKENIEVSSFVPNIFEDGGKCTATFSKGSFQFTKEVTAVKEGRAVYCPLLSVPVSQFQEKGEWNVSITYDSSLSYGISDISKFEAK
jgi:hypothetical protein